MVKKILLALCGVIVIALPFIIRSEYVLHLIIYVCMYSVLGMGFSMMWKNRLISVGQAGFWAIGAYTSALLVMKVGMSFWLTLLIGGVASAILAFIVLGIALRAGPLVFFAISLVFGFIVIEVLGTVDFLGGWEGIFNIPTPSIGPFVFVSKTSFYYLALSILVINIIVYRALYNSRIGRAWKAIGSSVRLAEAQGINVYQYRLAASVIACFFAGVIGAFYAHYQTLLIPNTFGFLQSIYIQMYALIGGLSYFIAGPIVGVAVMVFLPEYLRIAAEFQPIFYGILLILIIIFLPGGVLSIPKRFPYLTRVLGRIRE